MRFLRSIGAIVIGLGFMAATTAVWMIVANATLLPGGPELAKPSAVRMAAYLYINLVVCGVGAVLGGWLAARVAPSSPYAHAAAVAAIVAIISIPSATGAPAPAHPNWYPAAIGLIAVLGVLLGGKLRAAAASADGSASAFRPGEQQ
jgi:hypothetical protein